MLITLVAAALLGSPQIANDPVAEQHRQQAREHYRTGDEALHSERFEDARREFAEAVRLDPLMTLAHYSLGQALMALKRYSEAIKAFQGCRDAFVEISRLGLQQTAEIERRRTQEIEALRETLGILQRNSQLSSQNQSNIRRMEDRVRQLERTRDAGSTDYAVPPEVFFSLGSAYLRAGSLPDAEREYLEALRINPKLGEAHSNLAVVYLMTDRIEEAWNQVKAAEKSGFKVHPQLKKDIESRRSHR
jgi:tetratricopeptide (TPR) repeat protein